MRLRVPTVPFPPFSVHAVRDPTNNVPKEPKGGITQRKDGRTRVRSHLQVFLDIGRKHGVHMSAHRPCPVLGGDTRVCALLGPSKDKRKKRESGSSVRTRVSELTVSSFPGQGVAYFSVTVL